MKNDFKQTPLGALPQTWEVVRLGEVGELVGGGTPDTTNQTYWNGNILWLTPTEIKQKYISTSMRKITELGLKNSSAKLLPKNTILITTRATIGDIGISLQEVCTNQGFQSFISGEKVNFEFVYYLLSTKRQNLTSLASGSTFLEISNKTLRQIQIPLPPLKEQEKIAVILSAADEEIQSLEKFIKTKELYKKALMQKLFSRKLRFKEFCHCEDDHTKQPAPCHYEQSKTKPFFSSLRGESEANNEAIHKPKLPFKLVDCHEFDKSNSRNDDDWKSVKLGEILREGKKRNKNLSVNLVLSVTNSMGFVPQVDYFSKELASKNLSNYKIIENGNFAYNPARINVGSIAFLDSFENGILSPMYIIFQCLDKISAIFFKYWLGSWYFNEQLKNKLCGSVRQVLPFKEMCKMEINLPPLKEQEKIAGILSAIDEEIATLKKKFECLKLQKKALMQQLLSGKMRVK